MPPAEAAASREDGRILPGPEVRAAIKTSLLRSLRNLDPNSPPPLAEDLFGDGAGLVREGRRLLDVIQHGRVGVAEAIRHDSVRVRINLSLGDLPVIIETGLAQTRRACVVILGADKSDFDGSDLLTGMEEGVLAFVLAKVAEDLQQAKVFPPPIELQVRALGCETGTPDWGIPGPAGWYEVIGSVVLSGAWVPFRLLLPLNTLAAMHEAAGPGQGDGKGRERARRLAGLIGHQPREVAVVVAEAHLSAAEFGTLEPGDVLVPQAATARLDAGRLVGTVRLLIPEAPDGPVIRGEIIPRDEPSPNLEFMERRVLRLQIVECWSGCPVSLPDEEVAVSQKPETQSRESGATPPEQAAQPSAADASRAPVEAPAGGPNPGSRNATDIVGELPVHLQVEIGRLGMTLGELALLAPGMVLELHRGPDDPVVLRVGERRVGLGEIVLIEGELGVRILSLE